VVLLRGLERTHTFLIPINNPPFADNSPHFQLPINLALTRNTGGNVSFPISKASPLSVYRGKEALRERAQRGYNSEPREGVACNLLFFFNNHCIMRLLRAKFIFFLLAE
jgi:hypothetical protein